MRFDNLSDWLRWQETLHPSRIELRLERVGSVWSRLGPARLPSPVITVGGTNGKGSCVAYLDAIYRAGGYRTGAYTSPHVLRYNERIAIDGEPCSDAAICEAFARVDAARGDTLLTYFEFGTLAALDLFVRAGLDIILLEVGLGGRLDAVNIIDADVAVVTSISRDHMAWLGDDLDSIAFEKAGIFRAGRPAVIGQRDAPARLRERAAQVGAMPFQLGREFDWQAGIGQWQWRAADGTSRTALPPPALRGRFQYDNASAALCAANRLASALPLSAAAVRQGLHRARLTGRFTVLPGQPVRVLDVAHNVSAARVLAENLSALACRGRRHAVFGVMGDKEAAAIVRCLASVIDCWHLAPAPGDRAMPLGALDDAVAEGAPEVPRVCYASIDAALAAAVSVADADDCIVVFGSFTLVEAALRNPLVGPV